MKICPVQNPIQHVRPSFNGVVGKIVDVKTGVVKLGEQATLNKFKRIVEYHPFVGETKAEIKKAIKQIQSHYSESIIDDYYNYNENMYDAEVKIGKEINC